MWNINSFEIIKAVKKKSKTIIIMGGPNYPDTEEQASWLKEHPLIDFYVYRW